MKVLNYLMAVTGIASFVAILSMPFDYYVMLRGLVSVSAAVLAFLAVSKKDYAWLIFAIPVFSLWFPLFGVTMGRESWAVLNVLAGIGFLLAWQKFDFSVRPSR
jgi:hypothetical protein